MDLRAIASLPPEPAGDLAILLTDVGTVPEPFAAAVDAARARGEARASAGHLAQLQVGDARVLAVGVGDGTAHEAFRIAAAHVMARARAIGARTIYVVLPEGASIAPAVATAAVVEGAVLRSWSYPARRKEPAEPRNTLEELIIVGGDASALAAATTVSEAANWARLQQHEPPNVLTPTELAARAGQAFDELASPHLTWDVKGEDEMRALGMGALLAVSQGSREAATLVTARYRHPDASGPTIALVGKGVTFDTGGISIKPAARMHEMKSDMSGAAVVLGAFIAAVQLGLPLDLIVVVGSTENMPSSAAYKPGDVITAADGTTIEITNTDAEGRMVLADCLWHARQEGAELLVDVATLTGAVVVALGSTHAGLVSTDDALSADLLAASERTGELAWRLPLHPEYAKLMKSQDADLLNGSLERKAGTITGAYFLSRFAGDTPWAHLDIAGTAWGLGRPYAARGGSAYGLRLLVDWLRERAAA